MKQFIFFALIVAVMDILPVLSDHTADDCRVVHCPKQPHFECPNDSMLKSWPSIEENEKIYDSTSNPFERLAADGLIEEIHPVTTLGPKHEINKRSLNPDLYKFSTNHHRTQRKYKRDLVMTPQPNDILKRCCPEFQCICKACEPLPNCTSNQVIVEVQHALGLPGSCCHKYECSAKPICTNSVDDKNSQNTYWRDHCTKCSCIKGQELCHQLCSDQRVEDESSKNCFSAYLSRPTMNGENWIEDSDCTTCQCKNGERRCQTSFCPYLDCLNPIKLKHQCCKICPSTEISNFTTTSIPTPTTSTELSDITETSPTSPIDCEITVTKKIQNILREVDWVVVLALVFIISALITGFIVNQTREKKKKIYSTIPNSESSLSHTSTIILGV